MNSSIIVLDDSIFFLKSLAAKGVDIGFYSLETDELLFSIESDFTLDEKIVYYFVTFISGEEDVEIRSYDSVKELLYEEDEFEKKLMDNKFGIRSLSGY